MKKSIEEAVAEFMEGYSEDRIRIQMFNTPSLYPDPYTIIYRGKDGEVRYCERWQYLDILGTDQKVYKEILHKWGYE